MHSNCYLKFYQLKRHLPGFRSSIWFCCFSLLFPRAIRLYLFFAYILMDRKQRYSNGKIITIKQCSFISATTFLMMWHVVSKYLTYQINCKALVFLLSLLLRCACVDIHIFFNIVYMNLCIYILIHIHTYGINLYTKYVIDMPGHTLNTLEALT